MEIQRNVGIRIRALREKYKMSQKDLSFSSNLDRSYIASVESGKRNISIQNIKKITAAFGISIKEFFNAEQFD